MSSLKTLRYTIVAALVSAAIAGCAGAASGTAPRPTPPSAGVRTPADAVARVIASEPRLVGIQPFDTGLIGQSSWFTVEPASGVGAFVVTIRVGWGDCQAGCIEEHSWVYAVKPDGDVSVVSEAGGAVPPEAWPAPVAAGRTGIGGTATAGPVCPVETVPPDPGCAPRPVPAAVVVVRDGAGSEVARVVTDADGSFFVELPAGQYLVEPQPVEGLLGTAGSQTVTVVDGSSAAIQLDYDTGIR